MMNIAQKRKKSWEMLRRNYHDRGWVSPYQHYRQLVADNIDLNGSVLDVGCGRDFPMSGFLVERCKDVHGVDPVASPYVANGVEVRRGSAYSLPYADNRFDLLVCQSVLEHLQHPVSAFREFCRVLRPGGRCISLAAGKWDYVSVAARLIPNQFHGQIVHAIEGRAFDDTFHAYYRANTKGDLRSVAEQVGLRLLTIKYLNQLPYGVTFSPLCCRALIFWDQLVSRIPILHCLRGWILGCFDRPGAKTDTAE